MSQELILIASAVLGVILIPSFITARPRYTATEETELPSPALGSQPAE